VVECQPSKREVLNSNPSATPKKKNQTKNTKKLLGPRFLSLECT
jgi:hypothetical protein